MARSSSKKPPISPDVDLDGFEEIDSDLDSTLRVPSQEGAPRNGTGPSRNPLDG